MNHHLMRCNYLISAIFLIVASIDATAQAGAPLNSSKDYSVGGGMRVAAVATSESLRLKVVREAAMASGMRASLAHQSVAINRMVDTHARDLDDVYDFGALMIANTVVPPVIRRIDNLTEQSGDLLSYSAAKFQIVKQAQFATRPPTWRTYLSIPVFQVEPTHSTLVPANEEERKAADDGLLRGWSAGKDQANQMFFRSLNRLQNDYLGMMTYHVLLRSNMVTPPVIDRKDTAITGDSENMVLDQSTYRINARPVFNANIGTWLAQIEASTPQSSLLSKREPTNNEMKRANLDTPTLEQLRRTWGASPTAK